MIDWKTKPIRDPLLGDCTQCSEENDDVMMNRGNAGMRGKTPSLMKRFNNMVAVKYHSDLDNRIHET
ncbi:hypothetical protein CDAR_168201 [Caerostris darwini]|uniref:Uncharacterized protein n=1 Tax=Caerostris darwini TaxID=1538125 RepID=A0AAV4T6L1_9ARAC|nr:hypothetical protein CDAR_168201 [Caerostris darwini]